MKKKQKEVQTNVRPKKGNMKREKRNRGIVEGCEKRKGGCKRTNEGKG